MRRSPAPKRRSRSNPQNSVYHEWLGRAYGGKAEHAGMFSGLSLAKKTRKEFETAVQLDEMNFSARQALIEYDCSAPGIAGGGEDKARPQIARLAQLDAAEGHYAAGNCRRQKKDFATADAEFTKALDNHPKSADLIYDIGDYAMKHSQPERLISVANEGEKVAPTDPRGKFYRAVALVITNNDSGDAESSAARIFEARPDAQRLPAPVGSARVAGAPVRESRQDAGRDRRIRGRAEIGSEKQKRQRSAEEVEEGVMTPRESNSREVAVRLRAYISELELEPRVAMMAVRETLSVAIDALRANKLRAILTSLGVIIGSASIVLVVTIALTSQKFVIGQIEAVGSNLVWVELINAGSKGQPLSYELTVDDMNAVKATVPGVTEVAGTRELPMSVVVGGRERPCQSDRSDRGISGDPALGHPPRPLFRLPPTWKTAAKSA